METKIYHRLQKHLDTLPIPFPETKSGVEIKLLRQLFTEEEAYIALNLGAFPESVDKILKRLKEKFYTRDNLREKLHALYLKGSIRADANTKKGKEGEFLYAIMPLEIGIYESQVDRMTPEFARDFFQYKEEGFSPHILAKKTKQIRTIPVDLDLKVDSLVGNYDDVIKVIEKSKGPFAVMNCICRQTKDKLGDHCKQTDIRETCILIEFGAQLLLNRNTGREITKEETLELLDRAKKEGMILQTENSQQPNFICCCCACCCSVLNAIKKYPNPSEYVLTNYYAQVNKDDCALCENCLEICQMDAPARMNDHMEIKVERCIGCGLCLTTCDGDAISLIKKDQINVPPKNRDLLYAKIYKERFGIFKTVQLLGKAILS